MSYVCVCIQWHRAVDNGVSDTAVQAVSIAGHSICILVRRTEATASLLHFPG